MQDQDVFILAEQALQQVVDQIKDDQWEMEMPQEFLAKDLTRITLRQVINLHAYDDAWVPAMLEGKTMAEVGVAAFDGDLLGDDPKANFAKIVATASAAARAVTDLDLLVHTSFGDFSASHYLAQVTFYRTLRAHLIAKVIGVPSPLTAELAQGMYDQIQPVAADWRTYGVMQPEIAVPADATIQTKFLGFVGQKP